MYKGQHNIELDKGEFVAMRAHPCDTGFNTLAQILRNGADTLLGWLPEAQKRGRLMLSAIKSQTAMAEGRGRYKKDSEK